MAISNEDPKAAEQARTSARSKARSGDAHTGSLMSKSMHDGVEVWCDCCSCEAEPYWVEAMKEKDHGS